MSHLTVQLDGAHLADELIDTDAVGWWSDDNLITVRTSTRTASYRLPKRSRRVVLERHGNGRGALIIGGFNTVTVTVRGPIAVLEDLRGVVV